MWCIVKSKLPKHKVDLYFHDDVIKRKSFPCYLPFVRGIHRSPVDSPHKSLWRPDLVFSLICAWTSGLASNRDAGDLRRHLAHYDVTVMLYLFSRIQWRAEWLKSFQMEDKCPFTWHTVYPKKYAHGFCFVVVIHWLIFPYPWGLLHWHCGNLTIAPVPAKQPWWIWINTSCEFIMNDCITTTKQSTTKPCAHFLGYTVANTRTVDDLTTQGARPPIAMV